ncbi:MAG: ERAP1-like C-terminal domain-containing protein [Gemmatimonadota bacterium]|nr:MAG: ERAP1-like C-terminal domain-containing protein [Gemmatimonadota bacterium]
MRFGFARAHHLLPLLPLLPLLSCSQPGPDLSPGVSWDLAQQRKSVLSDVRYGLTLSIPESPSERIHGIESVTVNVSDSTQPLVFDFRAPAEDILSVHTFESEIPYEFVNGHIVVPPSVLDSGSNVITIEFMAGDLSLNRNDEFMYSLFVPDRASTAFPCFDQPNLKAVFQLTLETPETWRAVANAPLLRADTSDGRVTHTFADTRPISTYLFSFAAGRFEVERATRAGRAMHMYHRETDREKLARNRDAVFDLHGAALEWLEEYTDVPYPFDKFDFVLIPSFQYGGMEHPGAILYRASSMLHDESATQNQKLGRASLIAHETAHMWFGDLVTMNWFDDVWTKEVFANFMAAKIVNPSFPEIDHDLRFFLSHYPSAYGIDRTEGANPIRQPLDNLLNAGTLYGAIIYQKAPIVMRQLERLTGADQFREGMNEYLTQFSFSNATWPQLIDILDRRSTEDLHAWSQVWVEEPNRPTIAQEVSSDAAGLAAIELLQMDPAQQGRIWNQHLSVVIGWEDSVAIFPTYMSDASAQVEGVGGIESPRYVLAAGEGIGYGLFELDSISREFLLQNLESIGDPAARAVAWVTLWDELLEGHIQPDAFIDRALDAIAREDNELVAPRVLGYLEAAFWRFSTAQQRSDMAPRIEELLWGLIAEAATTSLKATYFNSYVTLALTDDGVERILRVWRKELEIPGLPLSERNYTSMARELALREIEEAQEVLTEQLGRIDNPDRRASFEFSLPALSSEASVRDAFFASLADPANREREPWVLTGLSFLHHPLRAASAEQYILPSLELLEEIQLTGDIFFPKRWLDATLGGHSTKTAAEIVRDFLRSQRRYPPHLRRKILQSADMLFRAAEIGQ